MVFEMKDKVLCEYLRERNRNVAKLVDFAALDLTHFQGTIAMRSFDSF